MTALETSVASEFIRLARHQLVKEYLPKIQRCLTSLSEEDIWWRAHETDNSIGNLVLHLCGNVRQWIVSGVGGKKDQRNRPAEFSARGAVSKEVLLQQMDETLHEADETLSNFEAARLLERRTIQSYEVTCFEAIFHVVEHFSGHVGQIIYLTKMRTGKDLRFYNL
ncbi:MAG: DinB family protein [Bacteroidota bacterium]